MLKKKSINIFVEIKKKKNGEYLRFQLHYDDIDFCLGFHFQFFFYQFDKKNIETYV
jgi:hypothetical protein